MAMIRHLLNSTVFYLTTFKENKLLINCFQLCCISVDINVCMLQAGKPYSSIRQDYVVVMIMQGSQFTLSKVFARFPKYTNGRIAKCINKAQIWTGMYRKVKSEDPF